MKGFFSFLWDTAKIVLVAALIVVPIRLYVFQPFLVRGASMEPSFQNGDYLIVDELSYQFRNPKRGEVIVFRFPGDLSQRYIKRVIGLPGETVEIVQGNVVVRDEQGEMVLQEPYLSQGEQTTGSLSRELGDSEYVVLGDNRHASSDSRAWGVLPREYIIGRALIRVFPLDAFTAIAAPMY